MGRIAGVAGLVALLAGVAGAQAAGCVIGNGSKDCAEFPDRTQCGGSPSGTTGTKSSSAGSSSAGSSSTGSSSTGSSSAGSSSGGPTCASVDGTYGCCGQVDVLYYCTDGVNVMMKKCSPGDVCGWDALQGYYDCGTTSDMDPSHPHGR